MLTQEFNSIFGPRRLWPIRWHSRVIWPETLDMLITAPGQQYFGMALMVHLVVLASVVTMAWMRTGMG
eukprot:COSAG01_NODE_3501_length_6001_cov_5.894443_1_plen_68_part_00